MLGGMHPSALPEEALQHADAVVVRELLVGLSCGQLKSIYRPNGYPNLAGIPLPRRDLFPEGAYVFPHTIYTTRGCPYGC